MGYGASKYIAERLLDYAGERLHLDVRIARVGQIAGPIDRPGNWNRWEWLPSLVISSISLGFLPSSLGSSWDKIDWLPIDVLAEVLTGLTIAPKSELITTSHELNQTVVFHPTNPNTTTWENLLPGVLRAVGSIPSPVITRPIDIITFQEWLQKIVDERDTASKGDHYKECIVRVPAIKLLDFYESLANGRKTPGLENEKTVAASAALRNAKAIKDEWIEGWTKSWLMPSDS